MLKAVSSHPAGRVALQEGARVLKYGDIRPQVELKSRQLQGVATVAFALDNGIDWILWDLAALHAGVACVPLPPFFTEAQRTHALQTSGCEAVITSNGLEPLPYGGVALPEGTRKVTFTSGSTGAPKGVCLPEDAMHRVAQSLATVLQGAMEGPHLCMLPLAVLLENVAGVYTALLAGKTVVVPPLEDLGPRHANMHALVTIYNIGSLILVPELLQALVEQTHRLGPLPSLRFVAVGGAHVAPELLARAQAAGLPVYEGYGLSECASVVALNTPQHHAARTAGRLLPHVRALVEDGELVIQNPAFLGYVGQPQTGPLATGDLATLSAEGFISIAGRRKNLLITSYGRNVSPEWVEAALLGQADIAQALVYGEGEPHLRALVVPRTQSVNVAAAVAAANATLPEYARVAAWQVVPPFTPQNGLLTGNGRLKRADIHAVYQTPANQTLINQERSVS